MRTCLWFLVACAAKPAHAPIDPAPIVVGTITESQPEEDPAADLAAIEDAMLGSDFAVRFEVESTGAVESRMHGELRIAGEAIILRATGSFAGTPVELELKADGDRITGRSGPGQLDMARPDELREALVVGLVRMGILHNLSRLVSARLPDHAEGGVTDWVEATKVESGAVFAHAGSEVPPADALSYALVVDGTMSGEATLWWDRGRTLPVQRHLTVHFGDDEMLVRETYDFSDSLAAR